MTYDVVIIGYGPAGVSASLYTLRASLKTLLVGKDYGALAKADKIENYYGFENPVGGKELVEKGLAQAKRLGAEIAEDEICGIVMNADLTFTVKGVKSSYTAKTVVLATGASRKKPKIDGLEKFEGAGVSYCAVCDAFFYRKKNVAVLGSAEYALSEVNELLPVVNSVSVLTDGIAPEVAFPENVKVYTQKIASLDGDDFLTSVRFADGETLSLDGLFVAQGVAGSADLARKAGLAVENDTVVGKDAVTNVAGVFVCGDCTGGFLQVAKAVSEGAVAGTKVISFLRGKKV